METTLRKRFLCAALAGLGLVVPAAGVAAARPAVTDDGLFRTTAWPTAVKLPASSPLASPSTADGGPGIQIIGGVPATESYPFSASIQVEDGDDPNFHRCGGTLISQLWVQTNAHCVTDIHTGAPLDPALFHIRVGSNDRTTGGVVRGVTGVRVYPTWNWGEEDGLDDELGDLALLKLDAPVSVKPIQMAQSGPGAGTEIRVIGWGFENPNGEGDLPTKLNQLDTTVRQPVECSMGVIPSGKGELCVDTPGAAGTCFGDSGSPAIQKISGEWQLVGSNSRGNGFVCTEGPDVFTDISYFKSWIRQVVVGAETTAASGR